MHWRNGYDTLQPRLSSWGCSVYDPTRGSPRSAVTLGGTATTHSRRGLHEAVYGTPMSIKVMTWVWDNSPYTGAALLMHLALADWANDDGLCWPSQRTIAHKIRSSEETVRRVTRQMESDGYLTIVSQSSGRGQTHQYRLVRNTPTPRTETPTNCGPTGVTPTTCGGNPHISSEKPPHLVPNNRQEPPEEPSQLRPVPSEPAVAIALIDDIGPGEAAARAWWLRQDPRPLGKKAWHALKSVCEAAAERGYTQTQIEDALNSLRVVPSIQQMDRILRNIDPHQRMSGTEMYLRAGQQLAYDSTPLLALEAIKEAT